MHKSIRKISYRSHSRCEPVPFISIQGLYLKNLGFNLGDKVRIDHQFKKIVITALDTEVKSHNG